MKEFKVGERVVLEITETEKETCYGCFFFLAIVLVKFGGNTHAVHHYVRIVKI